MADAHAQEWLQQDLAHVEKWVSSTMEHAEQRGLPVGTFEEEQAEVERSEHLGKEDIEKKSLSTELCIRQITWQEPIWVSLMVPARFGAVKTAAVVDTVAQVTIVISNMCEKLGLKPVGYDKTELVGNAKRDSTMRGVVWKYVAFQLGGGKHFWDIVEAGISDVPILGSSALEIPYGENPSIHERTRFQDLSCEQRNGRQDDLCAATECKIRWRPV